MTVFISWSGERSKVAALALREWLPLVIHYVDPWMSERDLSGGERWGVEVSRQLEASDFGIIVLTADSIAAPWILFEAGALSKAFTAVRVCPYLIDIDARDISGPLAQFTAKKADRASTLGLLESINAQAPNPIPPTRLTELFGALWPRLEEQLAAIPQTAVRNLPVRSDTQVLEELVVAVRAMESRLETLTAAGQSVPPPDRSRVVVSVTLPVAIGTFAAGGQAFLIERDLIGEVSKYLDFDVNYYGHTWCLLDHAGQVVNFMDSRYWVSTVRRTPEVNGFELKLLGVRSGSAQPTGA